MSNVGQAALTIVGFAIGASLGNPALGFYLGSMAGQALFPTKLPPQHGPRLQELQVQTSTIGAPIPRVYGTFMVAGNVIWSGGLLETATTEEVGGKGGPTQRTTTYSYRVSVAVGLCEGVISGVKRIWADDLLIYDASTPEYWTGDLDALTEAQRNAFMLAQVGNSQVGTNLEIYPGDEIQEPDPTIEGYEGAGNVPAYRGLAYAVFRDFELEDYGNRIPNFRFEVFTGSEDCTTVTEYSNEVLYPWISADFPVNPQNDHEFYLAEQAWPAVGPLDLSAQDTLGDALAAASAVSGKGFGVYSGYRTLRGDDAGVVTRIGGYDVDDYDTESVWLHYSSETYSQQVRRAGNVTDYMIPAAGMGLNVKWWSNGPFTQSSWGSGGGVYLGIPLYSTVTPAGYDAIIAGSEITNLVYFAVARDALIKVRRIPRPPLTAIEKGGRALPGTTDWAVLPDGTIESMQPWAKVTATCKVLQKYSITSGTGYAGRVVVEKYPLSPALPSTHADYSNSTFWTAAYNAAVARGEIAAGLTYGVDYPELQSFYYTRDYEVCVASDDPITLAEIVDDISQQVGITDADVTDLEAIYVDGYAITRAMTARDAIEPLRSYGFFDGVESGGLVHFPTRGKAAVATIAEDELAAHPTGEARPSAVTITRAQDLELPRMVRVHYAQSAKDYEPGEQYRSRLTTDSVNRTDVELAIAMSDQKAAQIADVLLYEAWTARNVYKAKLGIEYLALDPADAILLPVDDALERVRITSIDLIWPGILDIEAVRDDASVYESVVPGVSGTGVPSTLSYTGPTELILLDLPALRDADDDAGFYGALRPLIDTGTWRGGAVFRSVDNGASFTMIGATTSAAVVGVLVSDLPAAEWEVWDETNVLRVTIYNGTLESRTEEAILEGANAVAVGEHGAWEVVQFRDAALVDGVWELSGLLRGRRGTEHNVGTVVAGDTFVFLSGGGIIRLLQENASIGAARQYRALTFGTGFTSEDEIQTFTGSGEALKPFSPVFLDAVVEDDDDIRITWIRRGRLSQELRDGADIPLSEATEAYEVDILDGETVLRTISTTIQEATYTAAQQATDFGSPMPSTLTVRVYQMSAVVGRGYPAEATLELDAEPAFITGGALFDADAVIFTGEAREDDVNGILTWSRQGDGPRLSGSGFVGDGYEARYLSTATFPAWLSSSTGPVTLRATVEPYFGAKHATADRLVSLCANDATANPRLELAILDDVTLATEPQVALRAYTGSMQTQRMARRNWRFEWPWPELTVGSYEARPQGIMLIPDTSDVLISAHYEETVSRAFRCNRATGEVLGYFDFDGTHLHVGGLAYRASDATYWAADYSTGDIQRFDLDASLAANAADVDLTFTVTADTILSSIAWVTISAVEYLLALEYRTAGTPYLYVIDPADVVDAATFNVADRIKRMEVPTYGQGIAYRDGILYLSLGDSTSGGVVLELDLDTFIDIGADGASYSGYLQATHPGPARFTEDIDIDDAGRLWMPTEGLSAVGDDQAFLSVWSSALGYSERNTYQARYDGAGSIDLRINDQPFTTLAWTPSVTPAAVSIGGPPTASAGQANGFCSARIWNVVLQESDIAVSPGDVVIYDSIAADVWSLPIENPGAEEGAATGWTVEAGALNRFDASVAAVDPKFGTYYFYGGTVTPSLVRQRFDVEELTEAVAADLETTGSAWVLVEWWGSGYTTQGDYARAGIRFLDADSVELSETYAPAFVIDPQDTFVYRSWSIEVPANTRFIDVLVEMIRTDGTNNNGHWDDLVATLLRAPL